MFAKLTTSLFLDLHDLQRAGVMVDTRLILDDGDLSIHCTPCLTSTATSSGGLGWTRLEVTMLSFSHGFHWPAEAQQFVDILYGREHFTVIEDTRTADEFVSNNNCGNEYVKLEPI